MAHQNGEDNPDSSQLGVQSKEKKLKTLLERAGLKKKKGGPRAPKEKKVDTEQLIKKMKKIKKSDKKKKKEKKKKVR